MLVMIKGAGDLASGAALRFYNSGFGVVMTDLPQPTAIRRTVAFCPAITEGRAVVEGVEAVFAPTTEAALALTRTGKIAVLADEHAESVSLLRPDVLIDAVLAKYNTGTNIFDAPTVIALGPGFTAKTDCHAVVETKRGHNLGRVYYEGAAAPNTGRPGDIGGYTVERIIRAPKDGIFTPTREIGDTVAAGDRVATVDGEPVLAGIGGVLRGILPAGTPVFAGMKSGDVDPRGVAEYCRTVSDKARAVAGGALEAALHLTGGMKP